MREHVTTSVQGNLVARTRIHEQVHRGILVDVKVEVDEEVRGFLIFFGIFPFGIRLILFLILRIQQIGLTPVGNKRRIGKFIGRSCIISE